MLNFGRYQLPVLLWMAFIFTLSSVPRTNVPNLFPYFHIAVHFTEYSVLSFLCARAVNHYYPDWNFARISVMALAITILFAVSDEWHQTFVPGRTGRISTVFSDSIYAVLGAGLFMLIARKRKLKLEKESRQK